MKKILLVMLAIIVTGLALSGCYRVDRTVEEEGDRITQDYDFTGFTEIEIGNAFKLDVIPSDSFSITVTAGEKFLEKLDVYLEGDRLVFDLNSWTFIFNESPEAVITMPELTGLHLSGATRATAKGFETAEDFDLDLSGASTLNMELETGRFKADISGASRVTGSLVATETDLGISGASSFGVQGSGGDISAGVSGASRIELGEYRVENADIELSGASVGVIDIYGRLDVTISGASRLTYSGDPSLGDFNISGGSSIESR